MINSNVIICGVVKNCASKIGKNINLAIETGKLFNSFELIIYENNSTDNTKSELQKFDNINVISENLDYDFIKSNSIIWAYTEITGSDHPCRIEQISNSRNKVLSELNKEKYNNYDYIIWIDLDSNGWSLEGIKDSFSKKEQWDVIYANGIENNFYYDMYAYRNKEFLYGPEIIGEYFWNNIKRISFDIGEELIPIYSAFGGLGIFKKEIFKKYKYDCVVNDSVKEFYRNNINDNCGIDDQLMRVIIESNDTKFPYGYKDEETSIIWKSNSGYNKPVVCEHVVLNFNLINNGYRLFLNTKMIYYR